MLLVKLFMEASAFELLPVSRITGRISVLIAFAVENGIQFNNTYKAVRIAGKGYNLYYSVWCNNEHELYNLDVRHFLTNLRYFMH